MAEYYLDTEHFDHETTTALNFTKGSTTVTATGNLTSEISAGDYIRSTDPANGGVWYRVQAISFDEGTTTITLKSAFQQDSHSATVQRNRGDGSQAAPFAHPNQFTNDIVKEPGDILYMQNGQVVKTSYRIDFSHAGTPDTYIELASADWKETGSAERPIIDLMAVKWKSQVSLAYAAYWKIRDVKIRNGSFLWNGLLSIKFSEGIEVKNVDVREGLNATGIYIGDASAVIKNCTVADCRNLISIAAMVTLMDVKLLPSTVITPDSGLNVRGGIVNIINCDLENYPISFDYRAYCRVFVVGTDIPSVTAYKQLPQSVICDDVNTRVVNTNLEISRDDSVPVNGVTPSIKVVTLGQLGKNWKVPVCEWQLENVQAGTYEVSTTVKTKGLTSFPTADRLYLEVEYLDEEPPSNHVAFAKSTQTVTANDVDTILSATFTQAQDGKIRIRVWCGFITGSDAAIYVENAFTINFL